MTLDSLFSPFHPLVDEAAYGQWGDYVGGIWGTAISLFGLVAIAATLYVNSRGDRRNATLTILSEMMKTHDQIVSGEQDSGESVEITASKFLSDFDKLFKWAKLINTSQGSWSVDDIIDIAYTITYYGPTIQAGIALRDYGPDSVAILIDKVSGERNRSQYDFRSFSSYLSRYMRNLFAAYSIINRSGLPKRERKSLGKIVRAKLSNNEQALLALNVISHLGRSWARDGLITRYKPFSNIPQHYFNFDSGFVLKDRFPQIRFEWESADGKRAFYRRYSLFGWHLTISR